MVADTIFRERPLPPNTGCTRLRVSDPLEDEIIGVMDFSAVAREPDDDLLSMMVALGSQIGQFIERNHIADQLARYADELHAKNAQLEADLDMARDIQQVFLTNLSELSAGAAPEESWLRFCHCYRPAQRVGGDFFCVLPLSDNEAGVFICDVIGPGCGRTRDSDRARTRRRAHTCGYRPGPLYDSDQPQPARNLPPNGDSDAGLGLLPGRQHR